MLGGVEWLKLKIVTISRADKDLEQLEFSCTAGGNENNTTMEITLLFLSFFLSFFLPFFLFFLLCYFLKSETYYYPII